MYDQFEKVKSFYTTCYYLDTGFKKRDLYIFEQIENIKSHRFVSKKNLITSVIFFEYSGHRWWFFSLMFDPVD